MSPGPVRPGPARPRPHPPAGTLRSGRWISLASIGAFAALWELLVRAGLVDPVLSSSPTRILTVAGRLSAPEVLLADAGFTLWVFGVSLILATGIGVGLGAAIGASAPLYHALNPFVVGLNALPKIVLMPLIVLWLGIGPTANVSLATLMGSFPILTSTTAGIRSLDPSLIQLGRSFGASRWRLWRDVVLPGVAPYVLSGIRVAVSYAMVGALIAEFFASSRGIGHRMVLYMSNFYVDAFFLCVVGVAAFVASCTLLVQALERRILRWRPPSLQPPGM